MVNGMYLYKIDIKKYIDFLVKGMVISIFFVMYKKLNFYYLEYSVLYMYKNVLV